MIRAAVRERAGVRYWGFDFFTAQAGDETKGRDSSWRRLGLEQVRGRLAGLGAEINLVPGDSNVTLASAHLPPVDFAFIDGGHSYDNVSADWRNLQPHLAPGAAVLFDDYTNVSAVQHAGYGVRRLVDELSSEFRIELLRPIDVFPTGYGRLETRFALLHVPGNS